MKTLPEVKSTLDHKGHMLLLATLLLTIVVSPFLHQHVTYTWLLAIFLVLILLAAASTVAREKRPFLVALVFGIPALVSQVAVLGVDNVWLEWIRFITTALFLFWVCGLLLRDIILRSHTVTLELLLGAVNVYLMIGLGFAYVYGLIEHLQPGSFTGLEDLAVIPDSILYFLYFSFITMSTLGYGDISPLTPYGMTAAYLEAILGPLYLAILVARLVSIYIGPSAPAKE
jgi:hypothetical protein